MPAAVKLRTDTSGDALWRLAKGLKDANPSRRLLSLAAVLDGMNRADAAQIGGMDRQTLRDWVHRFNKAGPNGLRDAWASGPAPELNPVENIWHYLRSNWLSNACSTPTTPSAMLHARLGEKLIAQPQTIASIGMRAWAHVGQS